jgi:hypothetical protein
MRSAACDKVLQAVFRLLFRVVRRRAHCWECWPALSPTESLLQPFRPRAEKMQNRFLTGMTLVGAVGDGSRNGAGGVEMHYQVPEMAVLPLVAVEDFFD